jgi:hypothetical protein
MRNSYRRSTRPSRIGIEVRDEVKPPFLNCSHDILGSEAFDHLSQGEPVA